MESQPPNYRQKLTRRAWRGPAAEPPRLCRRLRVGEGSAAEAPRSLAGETLGRRSHRYRVSAQPLQLPMAVPFRRVNLYFHPYRSSVRATWVLRRAEVRRVTGRVAYTENVTGKTHLRVRRLPQTREEGDAVTVME